MWRFFSRNTRQPCTRRSRHHFRPRLEALEDRCCPSGGALQWSETLPTSAAINICATAIQPADGKIVSAGQVTVNGIGEISVTRLNPNGTPDTTFNGTGSAALAVTRYGAQARAVAIQPNGQIVVAGSASTQANTDTQFVVARFNANGSLDTHFGTKGYFVYNPSPGIDSVYSLAILPNGVILAGGSQSNDFAALELTPSGTLNPAFGSGGVALVLAGSADAMKGMAVVPGTGQIVLAGYALQQSVKYGCVVTLTAAGQPDPSFNGTGSLIAVNNPVSQFNAVAVEGSAASGYKLVLPGYIPATNTSPWSASVTRYSLSGALDPSFGGAGTGSFTIGGGLYFGSLTLEADGSIVVGGYQRYVASDGTIHDQMAVGHLSADGVVDTGFGPNGTGFSYAQVGANSKSLSALAIDPLTGDVVLGGFTGSKLNQVQGAAVARFTHP